MPGKPRDWMHIRSGVQQNHDGPDLFFHLSVLYSVMLALFKGYLLSGSSQENKTQICCIFSLKCLLIVDSPQVVRNNMERVLIHLIQIPPVIPFYKTIV